MAPPTTPLHESCVTDRNAPIFDAEWQRRAFGVAVALSEFGHYPWEAFQHELIDAIGSWESLPAEQQGSWEYYAHWLTALERVVVQHGLISADELDRNAPAPTEGDAELHEIDKRRPTNTELFNRTEVT